MLIAVIFLAGLCGWYTPKADAFTMDEYIQAVLQGRTLPDQSKGPVVPEPPAADPKPTQPANPPVQPPSAGSGGAGGGGNQTYYPQRGMTSIEDYYNAVLNNRSKPVSYPTRLLPSDQASATPADPGGARDDEPPATSVPPVPSAPDGLTADEKRLFDLINNSRIGKGISPVAVDMKLTEIARLKAQDMIENNYFGHISPTYGSPGQMLRRFGVSFRSGGENLCKAGDVYKAHQLLLGSPEHREIMMNPKANKVGVAVVPQGAWVLVVELFVEA
jgi:uncharacterized protein YkwD